MKRETRKNAQQVDYSAIPLTFESLADNNSISLVANDSTITKTIEYSLDGGTTWESYTSSTSDTNYICTLDKGECVMLRGNNTAYIDPPSNIGAVTTVEKYNSFRSTGNFLAYGNLFSLIHPTTFSTNFTVNKGSFSKLFMSCQTVHTSPVKKLFMATTTNSVTGAFHCIFHSASNVEFQPVISQSAAHGTHFAYAFRSTGIKTAIIPFSSTATMLFYYGFRGAPVETVLLKGATLPDIRCAFFDCPNLKKVVAYTTTWRTLTDNIFNSQIPSTGDFYCRPELTISVNSYKGIPSGWTRRNLSEIDPSIT